MKIKKLLKDVSLTGLEVGKCVAMYGIVPTLTAIVEMVKERIDKN